MDGSIVGAIGGEAFRTARAQPVTSLLVAALAATVCVISLSLTGQSIVAQERILQAVAQDDARVIQVRSVSDPVLPPSAVERVGRIRGVDWVVGLGRTFDVRPAALGGVSAPAFELVGEAAPLRVPGAWLPRAAIVSALSARRAQLSAASGVLVDDARHRYPVLGTFAADSPLEELEQFIVVRDASRAGEPLDRLLLLVQSPELVEPVAAAVREVIGLGESTDVTVEVAEDLLGARRAVAHEVGQFGRELVLWSLTVGLVLEGMTIGASIQGRRRDFGRRRVLGASRSQLAALVVLKGVWPGLVGIGIGVTAGLVQLRRVSGELPAPGYPTAVGILVLIMVGGASSVPAILASRRDPVAVLRVP